MHQKPLPAPLQKKKLVVSLLGGTFIILCLFFLKSTTNEYLNDGRVSVTSDQTMFFGTHFNNSLQGLWQNEGEVYFQENFSNYGEVNCGDCLSGVNYFNSENLQLQRITGTQPVLMYDVILNNTGNLQLETELQIKNSFQFQNGSVIGDLNNSSHFIHFQDGATYSGQGDTQHVIGYVGKTGDDPFIFPVGDGTKLYPIQIIGASATDFFKVAYFPVNPGTTTFSNGSSFQTNNKEAIIHTVHNQEFWDIDGGTAAVIHFEWDSDNHLNTLLSDIIDLVIAGWDGSQWVNLGQNDLTGSITTGSIKTDPLIPDNYLAFTFARVNAGTFPVEWLSFSVEKSGEDALLTWSTAQEIGADVYEIQRSGDMNEGFRKLGEVAAGGTRTEISHYTFTDSTVSDLGIERVYYRLRQVDLDGGFSFSRVLSFASNPLNSLQKFNLYPNPARSYLMIDVGNHDSPSKILEIFDLEGKPILQKELGQEPLTRIDLQGIPRATYVVRLTTENSSITRKLFKR